PRAVADVDLRVVEVGYLELRAAGARGDSLRGLGQELHQPDRPPVRARVRLELALLVDHGGEQRGVEVVVVRVPTDDLAVVERVPEALVPRGPGEVDRAECDREHGDADHRDDQATGLCARHAVSCASTSPTKASSSSSVPSFTRTKSARAALSSSGMSRADRSSTAPLRRRRTSAGAVTTTTASTSRSPPVSYRSGISATATGPSTPASHSSRRATTRGWSNASSQASSSRSAKTISPMRARS